MLFHSPVFLCAFLPAVLLLAWLGGKRARNGILLLASLFFYAWGEGRMVGVLLVSAAVHWGLALIIERSASRVRLATVSLGVAFDLGLLFLFKYAGWLLGEVPGVALALRPDSASGPPIGISFFTFQALSYLVDVHRGVVPAQRSPWKFALYLALFPQLIAGPIVRYADIASQIEERTTGVSQVAEGFRRFVTGLGKKVLLAGTLAPVTEEIFALSGDELSTSAAWLGLACYSLQIYLDFSGYSDMAIGIGRMLGFDFLENFLHPYASRSVTEFWRRWHVSLSTWFRDYLYIPLGGNRRGRVRTGLHLVLVFLLCGVWHGAAWTFVIWGLWHGGLLVLERIGLGRVLARLPRAVSQPWTILLVCLGWVPFNAASMDHALEFWSALAGLGSSSPAWPAARFLVPSISVALVLGAVASVPWFPWLRTRLDEGRISARPALLWCADLALIAVLVIALAEGLGGTSTPFIYFRF